MKTVSKETAGVTVTEPVETMYLNIDCTRLTGQLVVPPGACGLVVMPQEQPGGSSNPRVGYLARLVRIAGFGTLVCDLRTETSFERGLDPSPDFDRLATRLGAWLEVLHHRATLQALPIGVAGFGAAGAAALVASMRLPARVRAAVAVASRLDQIPDALPGVQCPTLLVVGEHDRPMMRYNRHAFPRLRCHRRFEEVSGAHHDFKESNALSRVAVSIRRWMRRYLIAPREVAPPDLQPSLRLLSGEGIDNPIAHSHAAQPVAG